MATTLTGNSFIWGYSGVPDRVQRNDRVPFICIYEGGWYLGPGGSGIRDMYFYPGGSITRVPEWTGSVDYYHVYSSAYYVVFDDVVGGDRAGINMNGNGLHFRPGFNEVRIRITSVNCAPNAVYVRIFQ